MLVELFRRLRRAPMFRDWPNACATAVAGAILAWLGYRFINWAVVNAVWALPGEAGPVACRAIRGQGACWAVIHERFRFILFGTYPSGDQWRSALACGAFLSLYAATAARASWKPWLAGAWIAVTPAALLLLHGGVFGLRKVSTDLWGGLPLTFVLSTFGFSAGFPLGIILALGRRSKLPAVRVLCTAYIEIVRGVPFVTFLFMAAALFPLLVPEGFTVDKLVRAQVAFIIVIAAYLAEVVRAGLDAVPSGQLEAAASLGLGYWRATLLVLLPQALRIAVPAIVNTFIGFFKDTSLVAIVGLFDLLGAAQAVIVDPRWTAFGVEVYVFASAVYFTFCFAVSRYSRRLEQTLALADRR
ncbi:MAG: amino acid ABC transporter permease [Acidobacteriota bacterium]